MKELRKFLISEDMTIMDCLEKLSRTGMQILFTADSKMRMKGSVTDGDIRRAILKKTKLTERIGKIANRDFVFVKTDSLIAAKRMMEKNKVRHVPLLDAGGRLVKMFSSDEFSNDETNAAVLIFAGGMGMRMRPLTLKTPKPLLSIGNTSMIESVTDRFVSEGFRNIFVSLNYKSEMIKRELMKRYRGVLDESSFIIEKSPLGTAGSLFLMEKNGYKDIITHNSDIITDIDFRMLLKSHRKERNVATLVLTEHQMKVEYGLASVKNKRVESITEKPSINFLALAGVNVISADSIKGMKSGKIDMNELIERFIRGKRRVGYSVHKGLWYDMGSLENYLRAKQVYKDRERVN